jgi:hypothetical protein
MADTPKRARTDMVESLMFENNFGFVHSQQLVGFFKSQGKTFPPSHNKLLEGVVN